MLVFVAYFAGIGDSAIREPRTRSHTQASQSVDTVNVHSTATTDTLTARAAESKGRVEFVLYPDQSIEHHGAGLVQVELVVLHGGLLAGSIRVPAVDLEGLQVGVLGGAGLDILARLDSGIGASKSCGPKERPRRSEESRRCAERSHVCGCAKQQRRSRRKHGEC